MAGDEGTIGFTLKHAHYDWSFNHNGYNFGVLVIEGVTIKPVKQPNKRLFIEIEGLMGNGYLFTVDCPKCGAHGMPITITWKDGKINLYIKGLLLQTVDA
jgi:hypothetical protein